MALSSLANKALFAGNGVTRLSVQLSYPRPGASQRRPYRCLGGESVLIDPLWNANGRVFIRQAYPLPATVVAVIPRLEAGS